MFESVDPAVIENLIGFLVLTVFGTSGVAVWERIQKNALYQGAKSWFSNKANTANTPNKQVEKLLDDDPSIYLMIPDDKRKIENLCIDGEWQGVKAQIDAYEDKKVYTYDLDLKKATVLVEQGFITITEKAETPESAKWRVTHDINSDLLGLFDVLGLFSDSKGKKPLTQISRTGPNYAYLRYKLTSVGIVQAGIQVGDEDVIWEGTDADTSDELATVRTKRFQIWTYPETLADDTVEIQIFKGYETAGTGTKETEIKKIEGSTTVYTIPVFA